MHGSVKESHLYDLLHNTAAAAALAPQEPLLPPLQLVARSTKAQKRKLDKSWEPFNAQGIGFFPIAAESLGAWHSSAILGRVMAWHTGEEEGITTTWLFQRLSVCLMCGNAYTGSPPDFLWKWGGEPV